MRAYVLLALFAQTSPTAPGIPVLRVGAAHPGPTPTLTCPLGATAITPSQNINTVVDQAPAGTTFCVTGVHAPTRPITLQAGDRLIGEFGAVIDGAKVTRDWDVGGIAVVSGWNCFPGCGNVTVQNLVIRNAPAYTCVGVFGNSTVPSDGWTIDHNEITGCRSGVYLGSVSRAVVSNNFIHHHTFTGYGSFHTPDARWEGNEIAYSGPESKVVGSTNVTFRRNYVHHGVNGIWYDTDNVGAVIEDNTVEDIEIECLFYEISGPGVIRRNTLRRCGTSGIFVSTSYGAQITENVIDGAAQGIQFFVHCPFVGGGSIGYDLKNNTADGNTITVNRADAFASTIVLNQCTAAQAAPYLNGTKALQFSGNTYVVPTRTGAFWLWGTVPKTWAQWQALGQDLTGRVQ